MSSPENGIPIEEVSNVCSVLETVMNIPIPAVVGYFYNINLSRKVENHGVQQPIFELILGREDYSCSSLLKILKSSFGHIDLKDKKRLCS